jgi:hypothetical protein
MQYEDFTVKFLDAIQILIFVHSNDINVSLIWV